MSSLVVILTFSSDDALHNVSDSPSTLKSHSREVLGYTVECVPRISHALFGKADMWKAVIANSGHSKLFLFDIGVFRFYKF